MIYGSQNKFLYSGLVIVLSDYCLKLLNIDHSIASQIH